MIFWANSEYHEKKWTSSNITCCKHHLLNCANIILRKHYLTCCANMDGSYLCFLPKESPTLPIRRMECTMPCAVIFILVLICTLSPGSSGCLSYVFLCWSSCVLFCFRVVYYYVVCYVVACCAVLFDLTCVALI
jgi:hypothetical protein